MELKQLKYVLKISECGTMLKASDELYISQSGLTRSLKTLENELKVQLFDRISNRLVLNDYGKIVVEHAEKISNEIEQMKKEIENLYNLNTGICIGSCAPAPLWAVRYTIRHQYPEMALRYETTSDAKQLLEGLNDHYYSAIILDYPVYREDVVCFKICEEVLNISFSKHQKITSKKEITFKELNGYNFLEYSNTGYWHEICVDHMPDSRFIVQNDLELYKILQERSSLLTFRTSLTIPRFHLYEDRIYIPIKDKKATLSFYFVCSKNEYEKISKIRSCINEVDWIHYRSEDFNIG